MGKPTCKYDETQLRRLVRERGAVEVLNELRPESIEDPEMRLRWKQAHELLDDLENLTAE